MALSEVVVKKGEGGLGRPLEGEDHISGMLFFSATLPTSSIPDGFTTTSRVKPLYSLQDAEKYGIKGDYSNETKATGKIKIATVGTVGDKISVVINGVTLGSYTTITGDTVNTIAAGVGNMINTGFNVHGYRATVLTDEVTITAKAGAGLAANSYTITTPITGTATTTITAFTLGANDPYVVMWYHISEFFRMNPKGVLWLGIYAVPGTLNFSEITLMNIIADGKIRQMGVFQTGTAFNISQVQSLQAAAASEDDNNRPLSIIYASDISASTLSSLTDLSIAASPKVSVIIGQDGAAMGNTLYTYTGKSVTGMGALLGTISSAKVSSCIAHVEKYNISNVENDTAAFGNGVQYKTVAIGLLQQLNSFGYIFYRKFYEFSGTFFSSSVTTTASTSDYFTIENNRTIDKAKRGLRKVYVPKLNSPLLVDSNGDLQADTVANLRSVGNSALQEMINNEEISPIPENSPKKMLDIDPDQDVLATSKLVVTVNIIPVGVAKTIEVNLKYTKSI